MLPRYVARLNRKEMEARRLQAAREIIERDDPSWGFQAYLADRYGVSTATVSRWAAAVRRGGLESLASSRAKGRPPRLSVKQRKRLVKILLEGADQHGFENDLWTGKRVAHVIKAEFEVSYNPKYIPQMLWEQLGFSPQKPARRPHELDPRKVEKWLRESWAPAKKGRS